MQKSLTNIEKLPSYISKATEQLGSRIVEYSPSILQSFSDNVKHKLANEAIKNNDYDGLKHILNYYENSFFLIHTAVNNRLDVEAVKIISAQKNFTSILNQNPQLLRELIDEENLLLTYEEQEKRKTEILKILMNAKGDFSNYELEILAERISKEEFDKFCQDKKIDLTKPEYKDLDLSHYKVNEKKPVYDLGNTKNPTIIDVILSRTFSEAINEQQLRKIYKNILDSDPISKQMLTYLALQIIRGNTIKILFEKDVASYYSSADNVIKVDTNFLKETIFNIDAVIIHEVGHFFYNELFKLDAMPFDRIYVKKVISPIFEYEEDAFVQQDTQLYFNYDMLQSLITLLKKYEDAAKKPVYKAAELLQFDTAKLDKYNLTDEYTEFFKQKTVIDVFFVNSLDSYRSEDKETKRDKLPTDVIKSLQDIYLAYSTEENTCANPSLLEETEFTMIEKPEEKSEKIKGKLVDWATETFLPQVIQELKLTPKQIHFLERIADYVNRGEQMYGEGCHRSSKEKYVELIVRYAELKVAGLDQEILSSFNGLVAFHHEFATPLVQKEIAAHGYKCTIFADICTAPLMLANDEHTLLNNTICLTDLG